MYFNSHAHVERDILGIGMLLTIAISTHTLTWSVTFSCYTVLKEITISTHTLTWSVTLVEVTGLEPTANFNSHAHVERDSWALNAH